MRYWRMLRPEIVAHLFWGQLGCLQRMAHSAVAGRCIIMLGCWQSLCRSEQRECWCRGPGCSMGDAVPTPVSPRNSGAPVSAAAGVLAAYGTQRSSLALHHHARMQANAMPWRAAKVLAPWPLVNSVSVLYRRTLRPEMAAHLFQRQPGCLKHRRH